MTFETKQYLNAYNDTKFAWMYMNIILPITMHIQWHKFRGARGTTSYLIR